MNVQETNPALRITHTVDRLWRMVASPQATLLVLTALAIVVCLGIVLPQRPLEAVADAAVNSAWWTSIRDRYGTAADWLLRVNLFDLHRSLWLRGLLGLLAFTLVLGAADLVHPRNRWSSISKLDTTLLMADPGADAVESLLSRAEKLLQEHGYRLITSAQARLVYAHRFTLPPLLVYAGLLLAILGLAVSERTAWWEEDVVLRPGQVHPVGHGTDLALRAEAIQTNYDRVAGELRDVRTELTFLRGDRQVGQEWLFNHTPSLYAGLLFYQTSTEPALVVQAQDVAGQTVALQTPDTGATQFAALSLRFREEESPRYIVVLNVAPSGQVGRYFEQKGNEQYILVPSRNLSLRILYYRPQPGQMDATFQIEAYHGAETSPFYRYPVRAVESLQIDGDRYTFRPQRYVVVKFGQDQGLVLVFLGAAAVLVGTALSTWQPPRHLALRERVSDSTTSLVLITSAAPDGRRPPWLAELVPLLAERLELTAQHEPQDA